MAPKFPERVEQRNLRLWRIGLVLPLTFAAALTIAATVFYLGWHLLGTRSLKHETQLDSKTLFDLVKLSFGVVAGAGALVALVVAYRKQRVDENGALREATRLHTERFTAAVAQLGDPAPAIRLGGVHALAGLADDAPTRALRQTCIDVLCAYLRLPYTAEADLPADDAEARHSHLALREVRHTTIRLISEHLRLDTTHPHSWQGHDFDFTAAVFDGGDFSGAIFSGGRVSFHESTFSGGMVDFGKATFSGSTVDFGKATFSGGTVNFYGAMFSSKVTFSNGRFVGMVSFDDATFSGATVNFGAATFSGDDVSFTAATFSGGTVNFIAATFSSGTVGFNGATFSSGIVDFHWATFSGGTIGFIAATFSGGTVNLRNTVGLQPEDVIPAGSPVPPGVRLPA
ncbi:pentapeptide repeat-containing protein [Streptomyces sp. NPDC051940]|uniref:pentapeptide repeat-containing protein n=1 Tax=Streptomyces sp. NPDC051940 TaxID=3155675 RepID=UPI0034267FCC